MANKLSHDSCLKTNRSLINSNFLGYKLLPNSVKIERFELQCPVLELYKTERFDFLSSKLNLYVKNLFVNEFISNSNVFYYFSSHQGNVIEISFSQAIIEPTFRKVFCLNRDCSKLNNPPSIHFIEPSECFIYDGDEKVYIINTNTGFKEEWEIARTFHIQPAGISRILYNAKKCGNVVILTFINITEITDLSNHKSRMCCLTQILKIHMDEIIGENTDSMEMCRFTSDDFPTLLAINPALNRCAIISDCEFTINSSTQDDSSTPPAEEETPPPYNWSQTSDLVSIFISPTFFKGVIDRMSISLARTNIRISSNDEVDKVIEGELEQAIDDDASRWIYNEGKLEIILVKHEPGIFWKELFTAKNEGLHVIEGEEKEYNDQILANLDKFTTSEQVQDTATSIPNMYDTEGSTVAESSNFSLELFNIEDKSKSQNINLSSGNILYTLNHPPSSFFSFCIVRDVDGVVFDAQWNSETPNIVNPVHMGTYNALGYVISSKKDKRFIMPSPDGDLVTLIDTKGYVFIYEKLGKFNTEYQRVAKFDQLPLDAYFGNKKIYILSENHIHLINIL